MPKFHVNPATGNARACKATEDRCPFGGEEVHYTSKLAAEQAYENSNDGSFGSPTASKHLVQVDGRLAFSNWSDITQAPKRDLQKVMVEYDFDSDKEANIQYVTAIRELARRAEKPEEAAKNQAQMQRIFNKVSSTGVWGGLKGYLTITRDELVAKLGAPLGESGDGKVQNEWVIEAPFGYVSFYDWKRYGQDPKTITEWNIGGNGPHSEQWAKDFLSHGRAYADGNLPKK